jgi:hypothetical protein
VLEPGARPASAPGRRGASSGPWRGRRRVGRSIRPQAGAATCLLAGSEACRFRRLPRQNQLSATRVERLAFGELRGPGGSLGRARRGRFCPKAAVRAMSARLLLLCLLFRSSWLTVEGGRGRRRHSAASPGRTGSRGRVGRRGWWRSTAGVSSDLPRAAASRESGHDRGRFCV